MIEDTRFGHGPSRRQLVLGAAAAAGVSSLPSKTWAADRPLVYTYVDWSDAMGLSYVGAYIIEKHLGIPVKMLEAEVAVCYTSLQTGKADVYSVAYMEGLGAFKKEFKGGQAEYAKKIADSIAVIGISEGPLTQGLAIPEYVDLHSIDDLNANAAKFGNKIIGIDPGSGLMQAADKTVKAYDLKLNLVAGSEATMEAAFKRAYERKDWIVATSWQPLPMWTQYKMRYLEDPKKTMMAENFYNFHIVRNDFQSTFPKAYEFFTKFHMPNDELAKIMAAIDHGSTPADAAAKWADEPVGQDLIAKWIA